MKTKNHIIAIILCLAVASGGIFAIWAQSARAQQSPVAVSALNLDWLEQMIVGIEKQIAQLVAVFQQKFAGLQANCNSSLDGAACAKAGGQLSCCEPPLPCPSDPCTCQCPEVPEAVHPRMSCVVEGQTFAGTKQHCCAGLAPVPQAGSSGSCAGPMPCAAPPSEFACKKTANLDFCTQACLESKSYNKAQDCASINVAVIDTELGACCCANDRNSACGNGICDAGETYSDCPLDCENPADALDRACHDYCVESGYPMGLCQNPFGQNPIWVKIAGGPSCSAGLPSNFNQTSSCYCETSQGCDSPLTDCCAAKREKIDLTKSENCCQGLVPQNPENNGKGDCMGKSCNIAVCVDQSQYCVAENYVVYPLKTQKCCAGLTAEIETTTAGATGSPVYKCKKSSACGNGICDPGETATSCPADCGGGSCYKQGETFRYQEGTCCAGLQKEYYYSTNETGPTEITIVPTSVCVKCGDGVCGKGETASNCSQDCQNQQTQTCNQACVMEGFASGSYEQTPAGFAPCICLK